MDKSQCFYKYMIFFLRYLCIVLGKLEGEGVIDLPLDGKQCVTRWKSIVIKWMVFFIFFFCFDIDSHKA